MPIYFCVHICTLIREIGLESREKEKEIGRQNEKADWQVDKEGAERVN